MNGEEPVSSAPVGEQAEVVSLDPASGQVVVDAVEDAVGALNRNEEFNKIAGSTASSDKGVSLGLPGSLDSPKPESAEVADTSTPIGDLVPNLTSSTTEVSDEATTTTTTTESLPPTTVPEMTTTTSETTTSVPEESTTTTTSPTTTSSTTVPSTPANTVPSAL